MASIQSHPGTHATPVWIRERRLAQRGVPLQDAIAGLLSSCKTLAVVGLSSKASRPSYGVAAYMQRHGYGIVPVNPQEVSVFGEKAYGSLEEVPGPLEIVVIFRQSQHVPAIVESAIRRGAKAIWMQEGVFHEESAALARAAGLQVVQDRCILKEHAKRFLSEGI